MKLLIFGATGTIGQQLVQQALEQGHRVTAFCRNPAKLEQQPNLQVFQGDVLHPAAVAQAVQGQDAVLCCLGAGSKGTIRAEGTRNIIQAMQQANVRRLICQTTMGVGESWENLNFFWKYVMFSLLLRRAYADHVQQENYVRQSHLDWTIVRPAAFVDGPRTKSYHHGFSSHTRTQLKISRADVADFMLQQLTSDSYLHQSPALSYAAKR